MNTAPAPTVSVITPTFNEADNIGPLLDELSEALVDLSYEIIVVDDDSPDGTWEVAEKAAEADSRIHVIRRFHDKGLSPAVLAAMETAQGEVLAVIDSDRQHDPAIIPTLVERITSGEADIAVGTRSGEGGSYGDWGRGRRFVSLVAATIARVLLRVPVADPMSGFFAIRRTDYERLAGDINPRGFKILLEFLGRGPDLRVAEVGYHFRLRQAGETKLNSSVIRNYLLAVFDLRFGHEVKPQFVLYTLVGLGGLVANAIVYAIARWLGAGTITTGLGSAVDPVDGAAVAGLITQIALTFVANNWFTFWERRYRGPRVVLGAVLFVAISVYGLMIQFAVAKWLLGLGIHSAPLRHVVAIVVAFQASYFLNVTLTWGRRQPTE